MAGETRGRRVPARDDAGAVGGDDRVGRHLEDRRQALGGIGEDAREDVYYYVLTLGVSPAQAQEVAQEVFLRLFTTMRRGETLTVELRDGGGFIGRFSM